jgi:hypothetical protein
VPSAPCHTGRDDRDAAFGLAGAFLRATRVFPGLTRDACVLARASRFALGFFQALARAFEFVFGDTHALLGNLRQQPCPLEGCHGDVRFAACLLHVSAGERKRISLTQAIPRCQQAAALG